MQSHHHLRFMQVSRRQPTVATPQSRHCKASQPSISRPLRTPLPAHDIVRRSARLEQQKAGCPTVSQPLQHNPSVLAKGSRKRKVSEEPEPYITRDARSAKKQKTSNNDLSFSTRQCIQHWIQKKRWPSIYFEATEQTKKDLEPDDWYEEYFEAEMSHLLARKKSTASLRLLQSQSSEIATGTNTPTDQKPRESKSIPYLDKKYEYALQAKGSYLYEDDDGVTNESNSLCQILLYQEQILPHGTLFRQETFTRLCQKLSMRNEARVIQDITRLIVPSAETLATEGDRQLDILVESVNEGWNNSIPVTKTRPQPDYAVGFGRSAFTKDQLDRLAPFVGDLSDTSFFMGTYYMYFPFLTCEVKCGSTALEIADRQNAHSMTLAVRAVVELFRLVKRETELHREILAFSVSHDHTSVRLYGHYPVIDGSETKFYRHAIHKFDFTSLNGKEKWTAYRFAKNIYKSWMPKHLARICSAIDQITRGVSFEVCSVSTTD